MITVFEGNTANDVYFAIASNFISNHISIVPQPSRLGVTRELLHSCITIQDPRQRWVTLRQPPINPAFAIAEVVWIMNGRKDSRFLNFWNHQLPKFAGYDTEYYGAYGYRLRKHFGLDQLERAYLALHHNPDGRQVVLQIWDVVSDFPNPNGEPVNEDIPCNLVSILKIRSGKLEWMQIMRSNDLFLGVPYNFIQFTTLQEVLAGWLNVELGSYNHLSDSLHVYEVDLSTMKLETSVSTESNNDFLSLPKPNSEETFNKLAYCLDQLISGIDSATGMRKLIDQQHFNQSFQNLLLIVAAEYARKKRWEAIAVDLIEECTNPMLVQAWQHWYQKFSNH